MSGFTVTNVLGHCFIPEFFRAGGLAIDCGANQGEFSRWLSEETGLTVHAFEADPDVYAALPVLERVTFHNVAIDGEAGTMELHRSEGYCSSGFYKPPEGGAGTITVPKIAFGDFMAEKQFDRVDLLKLDIEGSEIPVIMRTPEAILKRIFQMTVEFHDFLDAAELPKVRAAVERLRSIGFREVKFSRGPWTNVLFVNQGLQRFSGGDAINALVKGWVMPGLRRRLKLSER